MKIPKVDLNEIAVRNGMSRKEVDVIVADAQKAMTPVHRQFRVKENGVECKHVVTRNGVGRLNTPFGQFWHLDFSVDDRWERYSVVVFGELTADFSPMFSGEDGIVLRVDSGCESGQKFGDITCDCRDQLMLAMQEIARLGRGLVINIPHQDGRGMGNPFKLATLSLQEQLRLTTVEAASILTNAGPIDKRSYSGVVAVLRFLRISSECEVSLITNNPYKLKVFEENGYRVIERLPAVIPPTVHTRRHLAAKQLYLEHEGLVSENGNATNENNHLRSGCLR